jgi:hypothetical protein
MSVLAPIPSGLDFERLVRDFWHQGRRPDGAPPEPMTPARARLEATLQTELYWDPRWDELYGVHDGHVGRLIPRGLMIGTWTVRQHDDEGVEVCRWRNHRLIVTAGKNALASYLAQGSPTGPFMRYLSTGTGTATPNVSDTALGGGSGNPVTEIPSQNATDRLTGTASSSTNVYQVQGTTPAGRYSGQTIAEAGMHNALAAQTTAGTPSGTMYDRSLLSPVATMGSQDTLQLTFQITFT